MRIAHVIAILNAAFLTLPTLLPAQVVPGHTAGQFQVNESGAATYTIPISVVPGTSGLEPKLAIAYSSQGRNGLLGVGWSLSGLSTISRCPATLAQDGFIDPVDFDENDRLCLDGERLMAVAGVYGANATEYRTEQDTFSRVISHGQAGSGPASLTVRTKSGLVMEYGETEDSRIEANGRSSVLFWAVNRISDTKGNAFTVTYEESSGEYLPDRIDYTGNEAADLIPYASVQFTYETRPDVTPHYVGGTLLKTTQRLSAVRTVEGGQVYREYFLAYEASPTTGQSRLVSLTECGSDGSCFAPTTFSWPDDEGLGEYERLDGIATSVIGTTAGAPIDIARIKFGDFNGDGRTDIYYVRGWESQVVDDIYLSGSGGTYSRVNGLDTFVSSYNPINTLNAIQFGDFNGDGLTDIYYIKIWGDFLGEIYLSHGDGTYTRIDGILAPINTQNGETTAIDMARIKFGDFNGDGRTDIYYVRGWESQETDDVYLSHGDGTYTRVDGFNSFVSAFNPLNTLDAIQFGDFNGDGRTDIYFIKLWGDFLNDVYLSHGDGSYTRVDGILAPINTQNGSTTAIDMARIKFGDFNGDGKTDIYYVRGWESQVLDDIYLSHGDGTYTRQDGLNTFVSSYNPMNTLNLFRFGDFNGDGKTDIYYVIPWGSFNDDLHLSRGDGSYQIVGGLHTPVTTTNGTAAAIDISRIQQGDFNGDGKTDIYYIKGWGGPPEVDDVYLTQIKADALLGRIGTGHGHTTIINYVPLTDSEVYSKDAAAQFPEQDFQGPMYVVASYAMSNGLGGMSSFSYDYGGAKVNLHGRGFRGFDRTTVTDEQTGIKTTVFYERDYRCISTKIRRTEQRQPDGTFISEVDNTIDIQDHGFGVHFSFVSESIAKSYELDGDIVSTITTATDYDDYGNVLTLSIDYGDGQTETTLNTYDDDLDAWFLGRLVRTQVTKSAIGRPTLTRTSAFTYDPDSGLLTSEIIEPDHPTLRLEKLYLHDEFGNIIASATSGPGITSRTHTTGYDERGRFVMESFNALGHREAKDYVLGNLATLTGPNQLTTTWEYDGFGRQTQELRPDGTATLTYYEACDTSCPAGAIYYVRSDTTGAPYTITYFDVLDRTVRQETQGFDGTPIYRDTEFNAQGLVARVSEPYFDGELPLWTTLSYDLLGRVTAETAPGNRTTTTEYDGLTTTVTNPLGQRSVRTVDARGQLVASADNLEGTVTYVYDAFGNMVEMEDPLGNLTTLTYDIRGNKTSIVDPDTGTTTFVYNALGELTSQTDARNNTITLTYDSLGRMTSRVEPEGTSTWVYDTRAFGVGKLSQVSRGDYTEEYFYDSLGRPEQTRITIAGVSYSLTTGYDLFGRPDIQIHPTGFGVRTLYNAQGYAVELRRTSDNHLLWQANNVNARGQLEQATLGNGLLVTRDFEPESGRLEGIRAGSIQDLGFTYDAIGNLLSRSDSLRGLSEAFGYDGLNRLTSSQVAGQNAVTLGYDALGNITFKSDVGTYTYGENGAGPHAVTSIVGPRRNTYVYDATGNLVQRDRVGQGGLIFADGFESGDTSAWNQTSSPPATTLAHTSFNKPRTITEGTTTLTFAYGPEYSRYRQVVTTPSGTTTKLYVGGLFERETSATTTRDVHYIRAGGEVIAVCTNVSGGAGALQTTRYLHRDHLGSVQTITDEAGAVVEVLSFDPWGLRRNATDWSPATSAIVPTLDRGFTGHEHLDEVTLIHMNGRVYDPVIGRFCSADPFVQETDYSQNLNRYSYVLNNPLSLTDPSGFFFKSIGKFFSKVFKSTIGRTAIAIGVGFLTSGIFSPGVIAILEGTNLSVGGAIIADAVLSGAGFGLGASASGALLAGGNLGDILSAAVNGAIFGAINGGLTAGVGEFLGHATNFTGSDANALQKLIAHGTVQGALGAAQGGKFEHGFLSGAFGEFGVAGGGHLGDEIGAAVGGIIAGGTASKLGGGKFSNGALSAAFIAEYNNRILFTVVARTYSVARRFFSTFGGKMERVFTRQKDPLDRLTESSRFDRILNSKGGAEQFQSPGSAQAEFSRLRQQYGVSLDDVVSKGNGVQVFENGDRIFTLRPSSGDPTISVRTGSGQQLIYRFPEP